MSQVSLWQEHQKSAEYAELCNALYERELRILAIADTKEIKALQGRLKSLPYYVKRTAHLMTQVVSPLELDVQNASWGSKQNKTMPLTEQVPSDVWQWYQSQAIVPGLIVPIRLETKIVLDSVDRVDAVNNRFRTNAHGWFNKERVLANSDQAVLLKPNKKVMVAGCAGHTWSANGPLRPIIPSMRELLLSCAINWRNFKRPLTF